MACFALRFSQLGLTDIYTMNSDIQDDIGLEPKKYKILGVTAFILAISNLIAPLVTVSLIIFPYFQSLFYLSNIVGSLAVAMLAYSPFVAIIGATLAFQAVRKQAGKKFGSIALIINAFSLLCVVPVGFLIITFLTT